MLKLIGSDVFCDCFFHFFCGSIGQGVVNIDRSFCKQCRLYTVSDFCNISICLTQFHFGYQFGIGKTAFDIFVSKPFHFHKETDVITVTCRSVIDPLFLNPGRFSIFCCKHSAGKRRHRDGRFCHFNNGKTPYQTRGRRSYHRVQTAKNATDPSGTGLFPLCLP